jgi:hypothetical protein
VPCNILHYKWNGTLVIRLYDVLETCYKSKYSEYKIKFIPNKQVVEIKLNIMTIEFMQKSVKMGW